MADWGAFTQGLAGGIGQGQQMVERAQLSELREKEMAQRKQQLQRESDLHLIDLGFKVLANPDLPEQMKVQAYQSTRPIMAKLGYELPEIGDEWDTGYQKAAKSAANLFQQYANGEIDAKTAGNAIIIHYANAKTEKERKAMEPYIARINEDMKVERQDNAPKILGDPVKGIVSVTPKSGEIKTLMVGNPQEKEPTTDFQTFRAGRPQKEGESTADWNRRVSDEWEKRQDDRAKEKARVSLSIRGNDKQSIPDDTIDYLVQQYEISGVLPNFGRATVNANRDAFYRRAKERATARGDAGAEQVIRVAEAKSYQTALNELTKREQLVTTFTKRIDETSDKVLIPLIKKWDLQNPRFANWTVNKLAEFMGAGDLASFKLALKSVGQEVAKVEFNALGIQQLTDSASDFMGKVHDENLPVKELLKVVQTGKDLGNTATSAIKKQRTELVGKIKGLTPAKKGQPTLSPNPNPAPETENTGNTWEAYKKKKGL